MTGQSPRSATADRDEAIARSYLRALGGDDPREVWALVADDFRNRHHAVLGSACTGRTEYAARLPGFFETFVDRSYEIVELVVAPARTGENGHDVVVDYRFRATVDDQAIDVPGVMWITVRDGVITRRLDCWDSVVFHRQTGTRPDLD